MWGRGMWRHRLLAKSKQTKANRDQKPNNKRPEAATTATAAKQRQKDGRINKYNDDETKWSVSHPHGH